MFFRLELTRSQRVLFALITVLSSLTLTLLLTPLIAGHSLFILLAAVMLVAIYCGFWIALGAALAAAFLQNFFHQLPLHEIGIQSARDVLQIAVFLLVSTLMSWTGATLRNAYRRAETAKTEALAAGRARESLLAIVSHDLKNPLTAIRLSAEMIQRRDPKSGARPILDATERMERLIRDLLDLEVLREGKTQLRLGNVAAQDLMDSSCRLMEPLARSKDVDLRCELTDERLTVRCDRERVLQVLSNLLGNAVKFSPPGATVSLRIDRIPAGIRFRVRDNGPGIAPAELPRIFDVYWQSETKFKSGGIGLGLSIARGFVEAHGQKLTVTSDPGRFTEFTFDLPAGQPTRSVRSA